MAYYAPPPPPPPVAGPEAVGPTRPAGGADIKDLPARALGFVGAGLVILTAALPWLDGPGLPGGPGLATASRLWAVGGVLSDELRLAAIIWISIPLAGCALWALRCAVRAWSWWGSFVIGVLTLGLTIAVVVTVVGADGAKVGTGIWICAVGAVMSLVADLFHYIRTPRGAR